MEPINDWQCDNDGQYEYLHYYVATRINRGGLGGASPPMVWLVKAPGLKTIMLPLELTGGVWGARVPIGLVS